MPEWQRIHRRPPAFRLPFRNTKERLPGRGGGATAPVWQSLRCLSSAIPAYILSWQWAVKSVPPFRVLTFNLLYCFDVSEAKTKIHHSPPAKHNRDWVVSPPPTHPKPMVKSHEVLLLPSGDVTEQLHSVGDIFNLVRKQSLQFSTKYSGFTKIKNHYLHKNLKDLSFNEFVFTFKTLKTV